MKTAVLAILYLFSLAPALAGAETTPAAGELEIEQAFRREYAYLAAQREALTRQRQKVESKTESDAAAARKQLHELTAKLARMQAENDSLFASVQDAEKVKREERNRDDRLQAVWRKARRVVEEAKLALRFEGGRPEADAVPPEKLVVDDLVRVGGEAIDLSADGAKLMRFRGSFLDGADHLVESDLFRLGRIAVFARTPDGVKLLGPDGKGALRVVDDDKGKAVRDLLEQKAAGNVPVYLFGSLQDRLTIKKPSGLTDRVADLVPGLFLGLLFLMVVFLFAQLARI